METLEPRVLLASNPVIAEFQAINSSTIADDDGDFSDWIEIRNTNETPFNIGGWHLTDDANELNKWQIPNVTIPAGEEILVFASSKDRTDAGAQLHTNFKLSGDGEYLALVEPDGRTVSQDFGDRYPAQIADQSYGLGVSRDSTQLIHADSVARAFVPSQDIGNNWTETSFDDAAWKAGTLGVGYEILTPGTTLTDNFDGPLSDDWTADLPEGGDGTIEVVDGKLRLMTEDDNATPDERGLAPIVYRDLPVEDASDWEVITHVSNPDSQRGNLGIAIYDASTGTPVVLMEHRSSRNMILTSGEKEIDFRASSGNEYFLRLVRDAFAKTWTGYYKFEANAEWELLGEVTDGIEGAAVVVDPKPGLIARAPSRSMDGFIESVEIIVQDQRPVYGNQTSLDVQAEMQDVNGSIYLRMPFTVVGNPARFDELDFTTAFDDGFRAYLNGAEVAAENVPILGTWDSTASSVHGAVLNDIPIRQFELADRVDLLVEGENVLAVHGMNVDKSDMDFFFNANLLASDFQPLAEQVFIVPSPGKPNLLPSAPTPEIDSEQGVFFGSQQVELSIASDAPNLEIRFTLDGSTPTSVSKLYDGPITLTASAMLQARTFDSFPVPKFEPSNITSGTFIALSEELRDRDSDIPIVILDSLQQGLPQTGSLSLVGMNVVAFDVSKLDGRAKIDGVVDYLGRGGARDRGSSTSGQPKPNMTFETWGPTGTNQDDDENVSLLGLDPDSDWVLHAPYNFDRALIRNQMAFQLSNEMEMWAPDYKNIEVYFNRGDGVVAADDYMGVYSILEKISQGSHRVDVASIDSSVTEEPDISGGYIWKIDRTDPDASSFTAGRQGINWVYPKSPRSRTAREDQKATDAQQQWVIDHFDAFAETLANPDINDPEGYSKFIDPISWVDHQMHNVFIMNVDALRLSAYFHKDRNEKIAYGPVWDFDRSAESNDARDDDPNVWRSEIPDFGTDFFGNGTQRWWGDLFSDPGFWQLYVDRWTMWREDVLSDANVGAVIDKLADEVRESAERNFEATVNRSVRPRSNSNYENNALDGTFQGEVANLKKWLVERAAFMDSNFAQPPDVLMNETLLTGVGSEVAAGTEIEILTPEITFFNDNKLISAEKGATAIRYLTPTDNTLGESWAAVGFDDAAWSEGSTPIGFSGTDAFDDILATEHDPRTVQDGATTILTRIPFQVDDLADAQARLLILRLQYDDGYVAYINGTEVARSNLRDDELAWDSRARGRLAGDELEFEDIHLSEFKDLLVEGENILGLRAINVNGSNSGRSDILINAELVSRQVNLGRNPEASVYYTIDGSDPRGPDGNPSANAMEAQPGDKIAINENTRIIARNFDPSNRGVQSQIVKTNWSGPSQLNLIVANPTLQITELNFNPADPTQAELDALPGIDGDQFEFVEVYNAGGETANLIGVELADGVEFDFTTSGVTALEPGAYTVVVANEAAFRLRYGDDVSVAGEYSGNLNNNGEDVDLRDGLGQVAFGVNYQDSDPWAVRSDGLGATLALIDPDNTEFNQQSKYYSWQGSSEFGGSPGSAAQRPVGVVINEVLANTAGINLTDTIELHNTTNADIDISGWHLSDSDANLTKYQIPAGTILAANGYVTFDERDFNRGANGFALSGDRGDSVYLTISDGNGGVTTFVDDVHFRETPTGQSLARLPNGTGRLFPAESRSFGAENLAHQVGSVVITEVNYNPGAPSEAALAIDAFVTDNDLEFVELLNTSNQDIDLSDWQMRGGGDFNFDENTIVNAGNRVVLVKFNPDNPENANRLAAFRAHYGIDDSVQILGGYNGQLNNSDDRVILLSPQPSPNDRPNFIPRVLEDEVVYDDLAPWNAGADGTGNSLQRISPEAYGNVASSWQAASPTPGSESGDVVGDFDGNGVVDVNDVNLLLEQLRAAQPNPDFDLTGDGMVDESDRDRLIQDILGTNYGDANLDGIFNSRDLVAVFVAGQFEDGIEGNSTWSEGDWDGDGDFGSGDLVLAFQAGAYVTEAVPRMNVDSVGSAVGDVVDETTEGNRDNDVLVEEIAAEPRIANQLKFESAHDLLFEKFEQFDDDDAEIKDGNSFEA